METQLDIINLLVQRHMNDVVAVIFSLLDVESLRNCELVSKTWYVFVRDENVWKRRYKKERKKNPHFHEALYQRGKEQLKKSFLYKKLFNAKQNTEMNWILGKYLTCSVEIGKFSIYFLTMDAKRIALAIDGNSPSIMLLNRWTLKFNCLLTGAIQAPIRQLQLQGDFIFSSHQDGTICQWDLISKQLVQHIQDKTDAENEDRIVLFHSAHNLLISCDRPYLPTADCFPDRYVQVPLHFDTRITIRRFLSPTGLAVERIEDHSIAQVMRLESDAKYFAIFMRTPTILKIQIRSIADFQVIRELRVAYHAHARYAYNFGWLVTVDSEKSIRFWDVETLTCKCIIPRHCFRNQVLEIMLNSTYLIIIDIYRNVYLLSLPYFLKTHVEFYCLFRTSQEEHYWNFCFDELQIVTLWISGSNHLRKLVIRDFMRYRLGDLDLLHCSSPY
ncbi:uncharacterized protein LOC130703098 [Daphnia carinata]|uniref:uncharacterized protein LOC130703098 n=1 Tax=Daphnia carinata TaxID=120202 RepID=UPI002580CD85|nr:uncharacterized protein LOC130703098 [Daphnia carinata]